MPLIMPNINITIDMRGIANKIKKITGELAKKPTDIWGVTNTARTPEGLPYFWSVNNGTGVKKSTTASIAKLRSSKIPLSRTEKMTFMGENGLISQRVVGPNPPHHMRERVIPLVRIYFVERVQATSRAYGPTDISKYGPEFWKAVMTAVMDYTVIMLAQFTPVMKPGYYSSGYTPEPGELRSSYEYYEINPGGK